MDYGKIEALVIHAKLGDTTAIEALASEFAPFIHNLSRKSFIYSYEPGDIRNECFKTLFKCIKQYNSGSQVLVGYASNAIKNSVNHLIRTSIRRGSAEGPDALILDEKTELAQYPDIDNIDDIIICNLNRSCLKSAMKKLKPEEQELINYVYFKCHALTDYSRLKGISYNAAFARKTTILSKLRKLLASDSSNAYLN